MVDKSRWATAQSKEKESWSHEDTWGGMSDYLCDTFSVDVPYFEGAMILEVGAGTGGLHDLEIECRGVGIDPLMDEFHETILTTSRNAAELCIGVGERLPFRDSSFDYVLSINVLDHMYDPREALLEMQRVLRHDGRLLLDVNVFLLPQSVRGRLGHIDTLHPYHFHPYEVTEMVQETGFELISTRVEAENITDIADTVVAQLKTAIAKYLFRLRRLVLIATPGG